VNVDLIQRQIQFLDVVETRRPEKQPIVIKPPIEPQIPVPNAALGPQPGAKEGKKKKAIPVQPQRQQPQQQSQQRQQEKLPRIAPPRGDNDGRVGEAEAIRNATSVAIHSAWLVEQTKRAKQAKKIDPQVCCPTMLSALSTEARQIDIKRKKKKATKKPKAAAKAESESEEAQTLLEDVDHVILYDDDGVDIPLDADPIIGGEIDEGEEAEEGEVDFAIGDEDDDDDAGEEDEDDEPVEDEADEHSVHSVAADSESDDDDS
jgi:hypothetical protein